MNLRGFVAGFLTAVLVIVAGLRFHRPSQPQTTSPSAAAMPAPAVETSPAANTIVELSEEEQRRIGVQTAEVRMQRMQREIVAPARVAAPETALHAVSARIAGRIDKLFVNSTSQTIHQGEAIASIYSPQIVTAAEEYRLALENRARLQTSSLAEAVSQADSLVAASRRRLELWGLTAEQINSIASSTDPQLHISIYSPLLGLVTKRQVTEGQYVQEGDTLFEVTDLSTVWVFADVFQAEVESVRVGQNVAISADDGMKNSIQGKVTLIEPAGNPESRTVPVRIEATNPQTRLKPGMIVRATMTIGGENALTVPRSAVIDTGKEKIVFVAASPGVFEKRVIETGIPGEADYSVLAGLKQGERVVSHGAFLIDSQSRLTGGMAGLFGGSKEFSRGEAPASDFKITLSIEPNPPKGGDDNRLHVSVSDASGQSVTDAAVKVTVIMPAMPSMSMPEMRASADLQFAGSEYSGALRVPMAGSWNVVVEVRRNGQVLTSYRTHFNAV
jgi:RND family efflux transporter MFP subunit